MLNDKLSLFYLKVNQARLDVGNNAGQITDRILEEVFPDTFHHASHEGAETMLRNGVVDFVSKYLKRQASKPTGHDQRDFADDYPDFAVHIARLQNPSHYVPSLQEYVPIPLLIDNVNWLDEARRFKRQKGLETLAEAQALDDLYNAVMAKSEAVS